MLNAIVQDGYEYSIRFVANEVGGSYVAQIKSLTPDWSDQLIKQKSFGNGVAAESQLIRWMADPSAALKDVKNFREVAKITK